MNHKQFDTQTNRKLDALFDAWSDADNTADFHGYEDEGFNQAADELWDVYAAAKQEAETAAQDEAERIGERLFEESLMHGEQYDDDFSAYGDGGMYDGIHW